MKAETSTSRKKGLDKQEILDYIADASGSKQQDAEKSTTGA